MAGVCDVRRYYWQALYGRLFATALVCSATFFTGLTCALQRVTVLKRIRPGRPQSRVRDKILYMQYMQLPEVTLSSSATISPSPSPWALNLELPVQFSCVYMGHFPLVSNPILPQAKSLVVSDFFGLCHAFPTTHHGPLSLRSKT
ncbi:hypothetical protein F5888DRAFT_190046 [Russula emetica]|nr:hypothetical protein F5888DRAFT_190046 [Russula emetica]